MHGKVANSLREKTGELLCVARETLFSKTGIDMIVVYLGRIGEAGIGLISNIIVARALGPEKLGIFMLVITFSTILTVFMGFGLDQTAVKYIADSRKGNGWSIRSAIGASLRLRLVFIIAGGVAALCLFRQIVSRFYHIPDMEIPFMLGILVAGVNSLFLLYQSFLRGLEKFLKMVISNTVGRVLRLAFIVLIYLVSNLTVENVLWANIIAALIIIAIDVYVIRHSGIPNAGRNVERKRITSDMAKYSSWIYGSAILYSLSDSINTLMIGNMMPIASVGFYSVGGNLIRPFEYFPETINQVVLPKVSGIRNYKHFTDISKKIMIAGLCMSLSLIPIVVFAGPLIRVLYGTRYEGASVILQFLAAYMALCIVFNPLMQLGHRLNMPYIFALANLVSLMLGILLNLFLIPRYGEVGCAISLFMVTGISLALFLPFLYMKARQRLA